MVQRKIIHVDMDCFYAAIEMRDQPALKGVPVAIGGASDKRGVLSTCNYEARRYGLHSAMPTAQAVKRCPNLIILPVNMAKYRAVSAAIRHIFFQYTEQVEPLSLDEAFLDVTEASYHQGSATWIAEAIRADIWETQQLTASAGAAPNKFLAKIASDWRKPNGLFVIAPHQVKHFVAQLPVNKIFGVGKVTAQKLQAMRVHTCKDLQQYTRLQLIKQLGSFGDRLYDLCRGIDERSVNPNRIRKSVSVETTYEHDLSQIADCMQAVIALHQKLLKRLEKHRDRQIVKQYIKIKYHDFTKVTVERVSSTLSQTLFETLLTEGLARHHKPVRLLGVGVRFAEITHQLSLDF